MYIVCLINRCFYALSGFTMNMQTCLFLFKGGDPADLLFFVAGEVKSMDCWDQLSGLRSVNGFVIIVIYITEKP